MINLAFRFYLLGYKGVMLPRGVRRLIARSQCHRSWLAGDMDLHWDENNQLLGVCDRNWYSWRKGPNSPQANLSRIALQLIRPHR